MKLLKRRIVLPLILSLTLSLTALIQSGCIVLAAGAGAGAVAYVRGELKAPLEASIEHSITATQKAIDELKFHPISEQTDALSALFKLRNAQDESIQIELKRQSDSLTSISIRVGTFGDEALSQTILDRIKKQL